MDRIYARLGAGLLGDRADLTILEIGCADGDDTSKLVQMFPRAKFYCFEPDPRNIYWLKQDRAERFVTLIEAAVSDIDGTALFNLSSGRGPGAVTGPKGEWTYSSSLKKPTGHLKEFPWCKFQKTAKVKTVRLDSFAREHGVADVDFIWMDVQGAEDLVIAGGAATLARTRYLFTEADDGGLYEGQLGGDAIIDRLPGGRDGWEVLEKFDFDVLLRNRAMA